VSDAVFAPVLFFGGGVMTVTALSLTMIALRRIERIRTRRGHTKDEIQTVTALRVQRPVRRRFAVRT
jgi:hypothetical protein